ncbi:hypothetical protein WJX72_007263 [[Myrmecia] bisecta]|uniref:BRX domain-containing protein n=1 Tax=[Myrmecia] bisecta TaxID=41462 RepID=A0AAW1QAX7_9CHLO
MSAQHAVASLGGPAVLGIPSKAEAAPETARRAKSDSGPNPPLALLNSIASGKPRGLEHVSTSVVTRRPLEELLTALRKGTDLMKHGRHGKPKVHYFRLSDNDTQLSWRSAAKGKLRSVALRTVKTVVHGQTTDIFKRYPYPHLVRLSFSLIYKHDKDDKEIRTLDLTCKNDQEFELWFFGIQAVVEHIAAAEHAPRAPIPMLRSAPVGSPATASAQSAAAGNPLSVSAGPLGELSGSMSSSVAPSEASLHLRPGQQGIGGGTAQGRVTGAMGLPVPEHRPGDCFVWGASEPTAGGLMKAATTEAGWQHSDLPTLVNNTTHLDVCEVAVGTRHAALITHGGEMYTWGDGQGGKLGLGNNQNADAPQRVYTLWGKSVKHIACGDGCTAAITHDGALYTWGDGTVGNLGYGNVTRQFIPRQVEKGLRDVIVSQISCGPYHSAAIVSDGRLFTWGDGLCGKLGHGGVDSVSEPRPVAALADQKVVFVACGVWHTAVVARPRAADKPASASAASLGHSETGSNADWSGADDTPHAYIGDEEGGWLYTWGGEFTWVEHRKDKAGHVTEKKDSNKGCLGHGDSEGRLLPTRVLGALEDVKVRQVGAGLNLTVAVTVGGHAYQMGETGASGRAKWEGCKSPELVGGALSGFFVERVSVGMQHVAALAGPCDKHTGKAQEGAECSVIFMWGRGREGQLGSNSHHDSIGPKIVEELRGRPVLQVACGGYHTLAVCQHDADRDEAEDRNKSYKQKMKQWFNSKSKLTLEVPDTSQYSAGALTTSRLQRTSMGYDLAVVPFDAGKAGSGSPLDRDLAVTPREPATSGSKQRKGSGSGGKGNVLGLARAAVAVQRARNGQRRISATAAADYGAAVRVTGSGQGYGRRGSASRRLTAAGEMVHATSADDVARLRQSSGVSTANSEAASERGSVLSAPDMYADDILTTNNSFTSAVEELQNEAEERERYVRQLEAKLDKLEDLLQREMRHPPARSGGYAAHEMSRSAAGAEASSAHEHTAAGGASPQPKRLSVTQQQESRSRRNSKSGKVTPVEASRLEPLSEQADMERERQELVALRAELDRRTHELERRQADFAAKQARLGEGAAAALISGLTSGSSPLRHQRSTTAFDGSSPAHRTHRKTQSVDAGGLNASTSQPNPNEYIETVAQGVFLTFEKRPNGQNQLTRIRFSRQHFGKDSAEAWWQANKFEIAQKYNLVSMGPGPSAQAPVPEMGTPNFRNLGQTPFQGWASGIPSFEAGTPTTPQSKANTVSSHALSSLSSEGSSMSQGNNTPYSPDNGQSPTKGPLFSLPTTPVRGHTSRLSQSSTRGPSALKPSPLFAADAPSPAHLDFGKAGSTPQQGFAGEVAPQALLSWPSATPGWPGGSAQKLQAHPLSDGGGIPLIASACMLDGPAAVMSLPATHAVMGDVPALNFQSSSPGEPAPGLLLAIGSAPSMPSGQSSPEGAATLVGTVPGMGTGNWPSPPPIRTSLSPPAKGSGRIRQPHMAVSSPRAGAAKPIGYAQSPRAHATDAAHSTSPSSDSTDNLKHRLARAYSTGKPAAAQSPPNSTSTDSPRWKA